MKCCMGVLHEVLQGILDELVHEVVHAGYNQYFILWTMQYSMM